MDSNVLLDVLTEDPQWSSWSTEALEEWGQKQSLAINPIIYAEISTAYSSSTEVDKILPAEEFRRLALPYEAGFLAAKSFLKYRQQGGAKRSPLPDFYIGAHASVENLSLLTRDVSRYRSYFPEVSLIHP